MGTVTFKFTGGRELQRQLEALGDPKRMKSAARSALRKGAEPIVAKAKSLVPVDHGDLKESIKQAPGRKARVNRGQSRLGLDDAGDTVVQVIGIDRSVQPPTDVKRQSGKGTYRDPGVAGVGPLIEFGRPEQGVPAEPFMRPAFDGEKERSVKVIGTELGKAIERQAKIIAKKAGG